MNRLQDGGLLQVEWSELRTGGATLRGLAPRYINTSGADFPGAIDDFLLRIFGVPRFSHQGKCGLRNKRGR
jgi:hypothetical protein